MEEVVWLHEYRRFGFLLQRNVFESLISIQVDETEWQEVWVDNDDYDLWQERAINYESDD